MASSGEEFPISSIKDPVNPMEAKILTHTILYVSNPQQCNVGIIMLDALCAEGVQFNLPKFY